MNGSAIQWSTFFPGNAYYVLLGIVSVACLEFMIGQRKKCEQEKRAEEKDGNNKRLKINFVFIRWYLGNRKSYRDKSKSILKGKVLRFVWSFIHRSKVNTFGVIAVQSFLNFNRSNLSKWLKIFFDNDYYIFNRILS